MNAFIRQLAALAALWALCELLLGESRQRQMVHLTVSLMVMAVLIRSLSGVLGGIPAVQTTALSLRSSPAAVTGYDRIALSAAANQLRTLCCRMIRRAGYEGDASVSLREDGSLDEVILSLSSREQQALAEEQLADAVCTLLEAEAGQVRWQKVGEREQ